MNLTELSIKAIRKPVQGARVYYDDTLPGFGVRITANAVKSFVLTHGVRRTRQTIGRVGVVSLKEAREAAKTLLAGYTLGKHQPRSVRWNTALQEYLDHKKQKCRPSTYNSYERHLKTHFKFGETKMGDLSPHDFENKLNKLSGSERFHAFIYVRAFINWAYRKHYLDHNPFERMETPTGSKSRNRILTDDEIKKVWHAVPDDAFGRRVKLLLLCGQRPTETGQLAECKREDDLLTLPGMWTKNKRDHTFPIPKMAEPYLHNLSYGGFSKAKARLDKLSGVAGWTLHDLRRTFRSKLAELGVSKEVAEKYINHISGSHSGVSGVYDRYHYVPEMRAAVAKWESHLRKLLKL